MRISDWSSYVCSSDLGVLVYGHANGADIEATVDQVGVYREMGYRAVRAQSGIPGVKGAYGVGKGDLYYEPADGTLPTETLWSTTASSVIADASGTGGIGGEKIGRGHV